MRKCRPDRRFQTEEDMMQTWEEYKDYCDNYYVTTHNFSAKNSEFVSKDLKKRISYTIEGFCVFSKLARKAFYDTYANNPEFSRIVSLMREECEHDVRSKFETGEIPPQLSALWMSKFGYSAKQEINETIEAGIIEIAAVEEQKEEESGEQKEGQEGD